MKIKNKEIRDIYLFHVNGPNLNEFKLVGKNIYILFLMYSSYY